MQTRCPHCETRFRVTDAQLASADGYVRCGVCEHVFNVHTDDEIITDDSFEHPLSTSEDGSSTEQHEDIEQGIPESSEQTDDYIAAEDTAPATAAEFVDDDSTDEKYEDTGHEELIERSSATDKKHDDSYDLFDDRDENRGNIVPDEFRSGYDNNHHSTIATALWSIGILFLIATLFLEYVWFNRNSYIQIPQVQAEIEKLCLQFDCNSISLRVPDEIELVSRNVYSHPNNKDGLIVDITMKNNAAFSQPYPVLKIEFSDIRGQVIASRNFQPSEYLSIVQQNTESVEDIPPDTSSNVTLEVEDPGKQAMTYEFDFL